MAWLRDTAAPTSDGLGAYYAFEADVAGEAPDSSSEEARSLVKVPGLGLTFSVPLGALTRPSQGLDEMLGTRPPVLCWK